MVPKTSLCHGHIWRTPLFLSGFGTGYVPHVSIIVKRRHDTAAYWPYGAGTNRDVSEGPSDGPVPLASFAKVSWMINDVVVEVTELGFHALVPWTRYDLIWLLLYRLITNDNLYYVLDDNFV
ncbi:hypothetical protein PIB30_088506 [Stylosanthes scabra]|uniref:Uncharacterized protein n=1 Tax=Stylosanthes scabra TaxID=79078 RepID=A0ABU6YRE8_9FABA|nr:hypothetical protein [Stylosanthes scabra]